MPANTAASGEKKYKFDGRLNPGDNEIHPERGQFGINLLAGYQLINGAFLSAGYTTALTNSSLSRSEDFKNKGFVVKAGFMFHQKK